MYVATPTWASPTPTNFGTSSELISLLDMCLDDILKRARVANIDESSKWPIKLVRTYV